MIFSIGQYVYYNCLTSFNVTKFEIKLIFLNKPFCYMTNNSKQKELLRWNRNHFSSFVNGFQLPNIVSDQRVCLRGKNIDFIFYANFSNLFYLILCLSIAEETHVSSTAIYPIIMIDERLCECMKVTPGVLNVLIFSLKSIIPS